jgi:hypothetical protein
MRVAVPVTVADVFCTPLFTVNCRFWGALAVMVTVPGAEHVASPVEPMVAAVVLVFHERPSTWDRLRLFPLAKRPVAVYPTWPCGLLVVVADCGLTVMLVKFAWPAPQPIRATTGTNRNRYFIILMAIRCVAST